MLTSELKRIKSQVDAFLKEFFEEKKKGIGKVHEEVASLIKDIEDITLRGGDRFRPFMVYLGYLSSVIPAKAGIQASSIRKNPLEIRINPDLLKVMTAVELLHSFALIHDDIIDRAEKRRGGPTIKPDEKAILAGDICFTFADELLNGFSSDIKKEYDILREEVIAGELLDVILARESWANPTLKQNINLIHEYKTARYSFVRPFMIGYEYSVGAHNYVPHGVHIYEPLQNILINIGLAFQIKDDFLDLYGDARLGKTIGGDLKEGNLTVFHEKLVENKNNFDFKKYARIWHSDNITLEDLKWVKTQIEKLGIKRDVEAEMHELINIAKKEIEKIDTNPEAKNLLIQMADFVVNREY